MLSRIFISACLASLLAFVLGAQTLTTGDITGTIVDQSGGALAKTNVTLKNTATGATQVTQASSDGVYRFPFVSPGSYTVTAELSGFQSARRTVQVSVGQATTANFQLAIASTTTTIEVTAAPPAIQTDNANLTTNIDLTQVQNLPNPGNDLTYYAQIAPGAVMNGTPGYGNFSSYGLPATSNVFTVNGQVNNDTFLNLNNSGASNLMLGSNEVQEAAIVNNGYTGQYGGLAGAQMNMVTKSGGNSFHGNAVYQWNGSAMNANNFFNNASGTPKAFSNVNEWAASFGGPIQKNKTFFFADYEGLRVVLPTDVLVRVPSPQFATATLANLSATGQTAAVPFYQNIFKLYAGAPGSGAATPVAGGGCGTFTALGTGFTCADQFRSTIGNRTKEYLWTGRVDHNFGDRDRLFVRVQRDNGTQPTYTDPINPLFNAFSPQPEMNGQINENHTFSSTAVNNLIFSGQFYSARFGSSDQSAVNAAFPTTLQFSGSPFYGLNNLGYLFPQGRNVTQYQIIDDFSKMFGHHNLKAGINFHRIDLSDFSFEEYTNGRVTATNLATFYNGGGPGARLIQRFPTSPEEPFAYYNLGAYIQDEWTFGRLKIIPTLRIDHNSNPVCQHDCFARLNAPFDALNHDPNVPYNQIIQTGLNQAFASTDMVLWEPRLGFAWTPSKSGNTVLRGGFGIFGDTFPGTAAEPFARNTPELNSFTVTNGAITPGAPGNLFAIAAGANQSLVNGFKNGGTFGSISASNPFFVAPNYTSMESKYHQARYEEWNLEVQQALPARFTLSVNYVGNHGYHELVQNGGLNGYFPGFPGLPATAPDSRFGIINQYDTGGLSNYNGLTVSLRRRFARGVSIQANYSYSHALDEVSNGGFEPLSYIGAGATNNSVYAPQDPYNLRLYNYGNADSDVRHYSSIAYVWDDLFRHMFKGGPNVLFGGWTISGTIFARSGLPFTVIDNVGTAALEGHNFNAVPGTGPTFLFATPLQPGYNSCGSGAVNTACLSASQFTAPNGSPTGFGNQTRNQYRGPMYFDTDLSVLKAFGIPHWEAAHLSVGFQFFNLFNHANFDKPVGDVSDPNFGSIINVISPPTSILGAFAGADASGRIIQVKAQLVF